MTHDPDERPKAGRRQFLEMSALGALSVGALATCSGRSNTSRGAGAPPTSSPLDVENIWTKGTFHHATVDARDAPKGSIRARLDGQWRTFKLAELPDAFILWSLNERKDRLRGLAEHGFSQRDLAGPHNACIATYGGPPRDSAVSLNTAYKGMGFLPREDKLAATIAMLKKARKDIEAGRATAGAGAASPMNQMLAKLRVLAKLYSDPAHFDRRKQVSLELFSKPTFFTHTFLNMLANPIASASFLAYPTFELRAIPQLIHPKDPRLTHQERLTIDYVNTIHDFIHSGDGTQRIACIYHVIEVFEDTPTASAHGKRLV